MRCAMVRRGRSWPDARRQRIAALGIVVAVESGESTVAAIRFPEPGTYPYSCSVPGHAEAGMVGAFVLAPASS
ncbi:MAG: multicopper oxidase domain-containing protein [Candidatus Limnocylindria bacterium]